MNEDETTIRAQVVEIHPKSCRVTTGPDAEAWLCHYRRAKLWTERSEAFPDYVEKTPLAVGDWVRVRKEAGDHVVVGREKRSSMWARMAAGDRDDTIQVLGCNLDGVVYVCAQGVPEISWRLTEQIVFSAKTFGLSLMILLNKVDQKPSESFSMDKLEGLGHPIFRVCALQETLPADFVEAVRGRSLLFCGQSGVGKTSLLSRLLGVDAGRIGELSERRGEGKHTTTGARLHFGPASSRWIDTPGVRVFTPIPSVDRS